MLTRNVQRPNQKDRWRDVDAWEAGGLELVVQKRARLARECFPALDHVKALSDLHRATEMYRKRLTM